MASVMGGGGRMMGSSGSMIRRPQYRSGAGTGIGGGAARSGAIGTGSSGGIGRMAGGGGAYGGAYGGAAPPQPAQPMNMQMNQPPPQQYKPYQPPNINYQAPGAGQLGQSLDQMRGYSEGFMDPDSEYYQRLSEGMQENIGKQTEAKKRAAQLQSVYGGMGAGGAEMMQQQSDLGQAGLEQMGGAAADLRLQAPQMGMQALQSTFSPQLGLQGMQEQGRQFGQNLQQQYAGMGEQSRQFGAGLGEQGRQFGVSSGLQGQQMAQQAAMQQWEMQMQQYMAEMQQQQQMMQMMAGMY